MATVIRQAAQGARTARGDTLPGELLDLLPMRLTEELRRRGHAIGRVEELRLRVERRASVTVGQSNRLLDTALTRGEMDAMVDRLCDGSLYAHRDALAEGWLTIPGGIRVGVCGRAAVEGERIIGIYDVSGLNIRIPGGQRGLGERVCRLLRSRSDGRGVLIYAPPGGGKTTLLRCVAARMAAGAEPLRVVVIDTRGELGFALEGRELCVDVLTGYPRPRGIEIATRTMNAQLIVCDEIGDAAEAEAMVAAQNCGVPFVASAHGDSVAGLLRRTGILRLHRAGVFGAYVGIRRPSWGGEFSYTVTEWEEANGVLQSSGSGAVGL